MCAPPTHTHTLSMIMVGTCYWPWQRRDWQWWCPSINTSPCQTLISPPSPLFSPSPSQAGKNRILLACPSTRYHMAKPKKVENPPFSALWGSASNLSPLTFAQVNLSNWNPIRLCSGLSPRWTEFPSFEFTTLSIYCQRDQKDGQLICNKYSG